MPSSLIEVRRPYNPDEEVAIIDAVHASLVAAFRIPVEDRYIRLVSYEPHRMVNGLDAGQADRYTRVTIDCFSGRPSRRSGTSTERSWCASTRSASLVMVCRSCSGRAARRAGA